MAQRGLVVPAPAPAATSRHRASTLLPSLGLATGEARLLVVLQGIVSAHERRWVILGNEC